MENSVYYICKYTPLELLQSFGLNTVRLDPAPKNVECCDALIHPNLCGYGKAVLQEVLNGNIRRLFLVDCCDVCRRIFDVVRAKKDMDFLYMMYLPHKNGALETKQFKNELLRVNKYIESITNAAFDEDKARKLWRQGIEKAEADRIVQDHLVLTGAHGGCGLKEKIEKITGLPVQDDTCTGNRRLNDKTGADFFSGYAYALLSQKNPCMRMQFERESPAPDSLGAICHTIKFCDFYSFRYKELRSDEKNLLKIETNCTAQSEEQVRTRIEAFAELIRPAALKSKKTSGSKFVCGIDSGSASTNAIILDENKNIIGDSCLMTGGGANQSGRRAFEEALKSAGLRAEDIAKTVTTGYGRNYLELSNAAVTEISCHARGARFLYPEAGTVIDIGGQDSKVIVLNKAGGVVRFVMNDKCAAGTGRFLETMAKTLGLSMEEMSALGLRWKNAVTISSTCTVFAESEVVSLIAQNTDIADIINGLNQAIASKTAALVQRAKGVPPYVMTGGVANNAGVVKTLENILGTKIFVPKEAQLCGALGAALFALES